MRVYVLLFDAGSASEGIHSLDFGGHTVVLLFEEADDAERYAGLLEAQDFPVPSVEAIEREEVEAFCRQAGYQWRLVPSGFVPESREDRLLLSPPQRNLDTAGWQDKALPSAATAGSAPTTASDNSEASGDAGGETSAAPEDPAIEEFRRHLETLL
ncbi:MAG: DUF3110 domain-containing protein [Aphanocapsa feldmannii 277cV]|uniref:DUF3110 domain-containing protein n=2 Tax=Aphanocapsa feldmannii TaxID=192050 RepID=A0A524RLA5_9CHRO|nr:MAG: DUF3110 domain-containing protein [Aphanocapsa feldmannii 288cV]TGG90851.1 MAG: DUF3110 domain-containing protein [Aphanocapsa feldmannii 277cV]TGH22677.1 MAG: DUF3110 domain-containing protein [Aphanocapsa feldmannii 277cI]